MAETFYFKADTGELPGSLAHADPVALHDVRPEEFDIASGIHRIANVLTLQIRQPLSGGVGLCSFAAGGDSVIGWDRDCESFFPACHPGRSGIRTVPGVAALVRGLLLGQILPEFPRPQGLSAATLSPLRGY